MAFNVEAHHKADTAAQGERSLWYVCEVPHHVHEVRCHVYIRVAFKHFLMKYVGIGTMYQTQALNWVA